MRRGFSLRGGARRDLQPRRGFALLTTMWLTIAIAAVALELALDAHDGRRTVTVRAESAQAIAAARAGVATALSRLDRMSAGLATMGPVIDPDDPWQWADSIASENHLADTLHYVVRVHDTGAYFNINNTSEGDWRNFLTALQIDGDVANQLAASICDWLDPDDDARASGAEANAYLAAGRTTLPANRSFREVAQLRDVLGMTPELYDLISPYLIVGSSNQISVNTAPEPVLRSIPQFTDDVINAILARRTSGGRIQSMVDLLSQVSGSTRARLGASVPTLQGRLTFATRTVEITSTGWAPGGRTRAISSVQAVYGTPIATIAWRRDE